MISFACKISEEVLFPEIAVSMVKKTKSVVSKYDRGLVDKTIGKIDGLTEDYVQTVEDQFVVLTSKRDAYLDKAYGFADSHVEPIEGERQAETVTGKFVLLPYLIALRLYSKTRDLATSKYECAKSHVLQLTSPCCTGVTQSALKWVDYIKLNVVAAYQTDAMQKVVTKVFESATDLQTSYATPFCSQITSYANSLVKSEHFKEAKTALLDTKVQFMESGLYVTLTDYVSQICETWPVSVAIEKSQELYKSSLKYYPSFSSVSSA